MTTDTHTYDFVDDAALSLRLKHRATGDVAVHFDAPSGHATITLTADRDTAFGEIEATCRDGVVTIDIPPRPAGGEGGRRRPFSFGRPQWSVDVEAHLPARAVTVLEVVSGDVDLDGPAGPVSLALGSGDVDIESCEGGSITTGSGDVEIERNDGDLAAKLGSGDFEADHDGGVLLVTSGSGDLDVHLHGGSAELKSGTGDISVAVPRSIPTWLDLKSGTGDVRQDIDPVGAPADGEPFLSVRASTGTGDIEVSH